MLEQRQLLAVLIDFDQLAVADEPYDPSTILVRFEPGAPGHSGPDILPGTQIGEEIDLVPGLREVHLAPGVSVEAALAAYKKNPNVLYAEPNYRVHVAAIPSDPQFGSLWGMNNTGQTGGTPDADIDAVEAWDTTTGSGSTIVAVIDTGVDYRHPDLAANIWTNPGEIAGNFIDDDGNGFVDDLHGYDFVNFDSDPMDDYGHGTHVAGTIGAVGDNGVGVAGVNWSVKIMALKFLDSFGYGSIEGAIDSLNYAVQMGAKISNNSWGGGGFSQALFDAINAARTPGHIFVAAAGNESSNSDQVPAYPASYNLDNIISVAATDHSDALAYFSNYGATTVDLGAPGVNVLSTIPGNSYAAFDGTSMATPHVAGVVALVRDQHPEWSYSQVINQILTTVDPVAALDGMTVTGGRLNAAAAVGPPGPDTRGPRVVGHTPAGGVSSAVSSVRVTFNESIDAATFDASDIATFSGPNGSITVSNVTVVPNTNNRQFDITFLTQSAFGDYSLTLGPNITDAAPEPNLMDQDGDGNQGEPTQDQYTATFSLVDVMIFESSDVPAPIYDWVYTISYLDIIESVEIADLNVQLDITHTWVSDLEIYLIPPGGDFWFGPYVELFLYRGGGGDNLTDTIFDDEAATPIGSGSAPFTGSYRPEAPLSFFDGMTTQGQWQLVIGDLADFDEGWLREWRLIVTPGGGSPPPSNDPPVADNDAHTLNEDQVLNVAAPGVLDGDTDPDGDSLTAVLAAGPSHGNLVLNANGSFTYTPNANYNGSDSFTYRASDGQAQSNLATVTLTINPVNDAPVAVDDSASGAVDTPITFNGIAGNPPRLESNDQDIDGDSLSILSVQNFVRGTAAVNADGTVTFTPELGYWGAASFEYVVQDTGGLTDVGLVQIDIPRPNDPPVADNDAHTLNEDQVLNVAAPGVLDGDTDPNGDSLTAVLAAGPSHGNLVLNANGSFTYTPNANYNGSDSFTYRADDGQAQSNLATVTLTINPVNDAPVAVDDAASVSADTPITFNGIGGNPPRLEDNDQDVDGDSLSIQSVQNSVHGTAALNADGTVTFTPESGYAGPASFEYVVQDAGGLTDVGLVQINIVDDNFDYFYFSATEGGTLAGSVGVPLTFADADIVRLAVGAAGSFQYSLYFDGSDVGLTTGNEDIDAFDILPNGSIVLSTTGSFSVPGPSGITISGTGHDLLLFTPSSLGETTVGVWHRYFDGSDVGLTGSNENVDAASVLDDGRILISTAGNVSVPSASGDDKDLLVFTPTLLGDTTAGSWALYFDGSNVALTTAGEDVDALFVDPAGGTPVGPALFFSTRGDFSVPGAAPVTGENDDIVKFTPTSLGSTTSGMFGPGLFLDGSLYGLTPLDIDGIHLGPAPTPSGAAAEGEATGALSAASTAGGESALVVPDAFTTGDPPSGTRHSPSASNAETVPPLRPSPLRRWEYSTARSAAVGSLELAPGSRSVDDLFGILADEDWRSDRDRLDDILERFAG